MARLRRSNNNHGHKGFWKRLFHRGGAHHNTVAEETPSTSHDASSMGDSTAHSHSLIKGTFSSKRALLETTNDSPRLDISPKNLSSNDKIVGGLVLESHSDYFVDSDHVQILEEGGVLFSFTCTNEHHDFVEYVANLSSFEDEVSENCVPHYDMSADENSYTFVLTRCAYILPGIDMERLCDPEYFASSDYHTVCQPCGTDVWKQTDKTTFRITKPVIPLLFSLTVQFKVSRMHEDDLVPLSRFVGTKVDCGLLLERTKQNSQRHDSTLKAKSVLLYTQIEGGILVNHLVVILQSSIPVVIATVINKFGSWGLGEACETVVKTRKFTQQTIPTT